MMKRVLVLLAVVAVSSSCAPPTPTDLCLGRADGDLVVTEVMPDPDGVDTGAEWIEIFNTLGTPIELKGMTVFTSDAVGGGLKSHPIKAGTIPARGYFVLGDVRSGPNPPWVGYSYGTSLSALPNASGAVGIKCGQQAIAKYTWNTAAKAGRSRSLNGALDPSSALAAAETNYCDTPASVVYSAPNAGTPGSANAACSAVANPGECLDQSTGATRAPVAAQAGEVLITEVMARPKTVGATVGEWVELHALADVDLNGLKLATASTSTTITQTECLHVSAGQYVLLARNSDATANGNLPAPAFVYGSLSIPDTTQQTLTLSSADATIDQVVFFPSASGRAWQLDPLKLDAASNDLPESFCVAPTQWTVGVGDYGSPGAANPACPVAADTSVCFDEAIMSSRSIRQPAAGDLVFTEFMPDPSAVGDSDGEFIEVLAKNAVDLNGLTLLVGSARTSVNSPSCLPALANTYLLFGRTDDPLLNGGLPPLVASFGGLTNTSQTISLLGSDGGVFDTISYSGSTPGASTQIAPGFEDPTLNDDLANRCRSPNKWNPDGGGDFGSPGAANPACSGGPADAGNPDECFDTNTQAIRPLVRPAAGDLVITEWMPAPSTITGGDGEFFEVLAKVALDLNGVAVQVGTGRKVLSSPNCLAVPANDYFVFAKNQSASLNGNLPTPTDLFTGSLTNTGQTITVLLPDAGISDSITYGTAGNAAWPQGASMQVKPGFETPADNDVAANLCVTAAGVRYGVVGVDGGATGDRGTPGLPNVCP